MREAVLGRRVPELDYQVHILLYLLLDYHGHLLNLSVRQFLQWKAM